MLRLVVFALTAFLVVVGVGMILSVTVGGVMFGLGCFSAALALWLLYRGVLALELQAELLAQSLHQRSRGRVEGPPARSEPLHEEGSASRPVPAGD